VSLLLDGGGPEGLPVCASACVSFETPAMRPGDTLLYKVAVASDMDTSPASAGARLKSDDAQAELSLLGAMDAARSTAVAPRLGVARKAAKPLFEQDRPWEPHIDNGYPSVIYQPDAPRGTAQWLLFYDAYTTGKVGCSFARTAPFQNSPPKASRKR